MSFKHMWLTEHRYRAQCFPSYLLLVQLDEEDILSRLQRRKLKVEEAK